MLRNIQYLRALAALLVTVGHDLKLIGDKVYASDQPLIRHFRESGGVGVDLFFVISGFIMFYISGRDASTLRAALTFWAKRISRVMPIYWIFTTVVLAFYLTGIPQSTIDFSAYYLLRSYLLLPVLDQQGDLGPILQVGWTLIYEMFFYFLFGAALLARSGWRVALISVLMLGLVGSGYLLPALDQQSIVFATYTSPLLLEFLFGVWIAKLYLDGHQWPLGLAAFAMVAGLVAASLLYTGVEAMRPYLSGLPAALVVMAALQLERLNQGKSTILKAVEKLGDASYSLYLIHSVLLFGVSFLVRRIPTPTAGSAALVFVVTLALQIAAALLFYRLVEKPITNRLHQRFFKRKAKAVS